MSIAGIVCAIMGTAALTLAGLLQWVKWHGYGYQGGQWFSDLYYTGLNLTSAGLAFVGAMLVIFGVYLVQEEEKLPKFDGSLHLNDKPSEESTDRQR